MSVINHLPNWARPQAEAFKASGSLPGEGVKRQAIPPEALGQVEQQLTGELDQLIQADESPLDQAQGSVGLVKMNQMGMKATANFTGDTREGELAVEVAGPMVTAAYAEFSAQTATIVQVMDMGGQYATVGAHLDRQDPSKSYVETQNLPDEFNIFAG
jgi:hypothetical protein